MKKNHNWTTCLWIFAAGVFMFIAGTCMWINAKDIQRESYESANLNQKLCEYSFSLGETCAACIVRVNFGLKGKETDENCRKYVKISFDKGLINRDNETHTKLLNHFCPECK